MRTRSPFSQKDIKREEQNVVKWLENMLFTWADNGTVWKSLTARCVDCSVVCADSSFFFLCNNSCVKGQDPFVTISSDFHMDYWKTSSRLICLPSFFFSLTAADGPSFFNSHYLQFKSKILTFLFKKNPKHSSWHASVWECILRSLWNSGADAFICRWCNYK